MSQYTISNFGVGPTELIGGDFENGFFGEVPSNQLISGKSLSSMIGLHSGELQFSDEPWLKFARHGNILYVAKKCYRYGLSWDDINRADAVFGTRILNIGGRRYRIRLIRGSKSNPAKWDNRRTDAYNDPLNSHGSEWNDLLYPVHQDRPSSQNGPNYRSELPSDMLLRLRDNMTISDFSRYFSGTLNLSVSNIIAIKALLPEHIAQEFQNTVDNLWVPYSNYDITVADWFGRNTWCMERWHYNPWDVDYAVQRGCESIAYATVRDVTGNNESFGWRPVLELTNY